MRVRSMVLAIVVAALALLLGGSAGASDVLVNPDIVCGLIQPGSAEVSWSGDTAIGGVIGFGVSCDTRIVFYQWNGGAIGSSSTYQASPGQSGTLTVYVGSAVYNPCSGADCPYSASTSWTDPNSSGGGGGGGCTSNCTGGGGTGGAVPVVTLTNNGPIYSGATAIVSYTATNSPMSCTISGQSVVPPAGSITVGPLTTDTTYYATCQNANGTSAQASITVSIKAGSTGGGTPSTLTIQNAESSTLGTPGFNTTACLRWLPTITYKPPTPPYAGGLLVTEARMNCVGVPVEKIQADVQFYGSLNTGRYATWRKKGPVLYNTLEDMDDIDVVDTYRCQYTTYSPTFWEVSVYYYAMNILGGADEQFVDSATYEVKGIPNCNV